MILKQIRYDSATGFSNFEYNKLIPTLVEPDNGNDDSNTDLTNAYDIVKLENFDYHLNYDVEDVLTSFTSNNGQWTWSLCADSYGDLTRIRVLNPYVPFSIALIWEHYDIRKKDVEIEDKGKLTDVILLALDGSPLFLDLNIIPNRASCAPGENVQFVAQMTLQDGSLMDVTLDSDWTIYLNNTEMEVSKGKITNAQTGNWTVMVSAQGQQATSILEVDPITIVLEPLNAIINPNETVQFTSYLLKGTTKTKLPWNSCSWSITSDDGVSSVPSISNGLVNNTNKPGGKYTVSAIYNGNTANAGLSINRPSLLIDPSYKEISEGDTVQFNALLKLGNTLATVTTNCNWSISPSGPNLNNSSKKGYVSNTANAQGIYEITATYSSLSLTAFGKVKILDAQFWIEPTTASIDQGQTYQYKAYYKDGSGFVSEVTNLCSWTVENPCNILNGLVSNTNTPGTYGVEATYNGKQSTANIKISAPKLEIRPDTQTIKLMHEANYRVYYTSSSGERDVTDIVTWSINAPTFIISKGKIYNCNIPGTYEVKVVFNNSGKTYIDTASLVVKDISLLVTPSNQLVNLGSTTIVTAYSEGVDVTMSSVWTRNGNVVPNFDGHVTVNESGPIVMIATYKGKTAQGIINVKMKSLVIVPGSYAINLGDTKTFKAYLRSSGDADIDVTNDCNWNIDSPLTITQSGQIGNTNQIGVYKVTALYRPVPSLVADAEVVIAEYTFNIHSTNLTLQVRDNSDLDGDCITIWVNGIVVLDDFKLTASWNDVICNLQSGTNSIKIGATSNGIDWYYDSNYGPQYGAGMVTASVRGIQSDSKSVIIPETLLNIDCPTRGIERISLDPNQYFKIWSAVVT
jgi:hypothetical protein